jgi:hypothetical protein
MGGISRMIKKGIWNFTKITVWDKEDEITQIGIKSDEMKKFRDFIKATHPTATMIMISIDDMKEEDV